MASMFCKHLNPSTDVRETYTHSLGQIRLLNRALDVVVMSPKGDKPVKVWNVQGCEVSLLFLFFKAQYMVPF